MLFTLITNKPSNWRTIIGLKYKSLIEAVAFLSVIPDTLIFKVEPGRSLVLSNDVFDASSTADYVEETYADVQYFSDFNYMTEIKAKAGDNDATYSGSIQIEYVVASS